MHFLKIIIKIGKLKKMIESEKDFQDRQNTHKHLVKLLSITHDTKIIRQTLEQLERLTEEIDHYKYMHHIE